MLVILALTGGFASGADLPTPSLSFGTGSRGCSPPASCRAAVKDALQLGWRGLDCAWEYGTQRLVAQGMNDSGVDRAEVFLATKVPGPVGRAKTLEYLHDDLAQLGTAYVDLLLMHYPCGPSWAQPRDGCNASDGAEARLETRVAFFFGACRRRTRRGRDGSEW